MRWHLESNLGAAQVVAGALVIASLGLVVCDDQGCGFNDHSIMTFPVTAGQTYLLSVGG